MKGFTRYRIFFILIQISPCFSLFAQEKQKVDLIHADVLEYDEAATGPFKRLIGNVRFGHENTIMDCDSAHFYSEINYLEAYSRVHMIKGDTLHLFGDTLKYFGDRKMCELFGKIKLKDKSMTLTTDRLDYDMNTETAKYRTGGKVVDKENVLTSREGDFYGHESEVHFRKEVILTTPDYIILSDTLGYNTSTHTALFFGPTTLSGEETFGFCKGGWHNTEKKVSLFYHQAELCFEGKELQGDTIFHEKEKKFSRVTGNMILTDTAEKVILKGMFGTHSGKEDSTFITGRALMIQLMGEDSLYLHGDTMISKPDSAGREYLAAHENEEVPDDSVKKNMQVFHHVKIFKSDLQGKCDSLIYRYRDSLIIFYTSPVIWSEENQLTAKQISMQLSGGTIDRLFMNQSALIVSQLDTVRYNQISGKDMTGYFEQGALSRIHVLGNGHSLYYAKDDREKFIGFNKAEGAEIMIYMKEKKVDKIHILDKPKAVFHPMNKLNSGDQKLDGFIWREGERPVDKEAVFLP